jgi:hypothetical protein
VLFHCKPVNQQKTTIFALILWEEQRLNREFSLVEEFFENLKLGSYFWKYYSIFKTF